MLAAQVLFSDAHWVGDAESNPSETPLDMPDNLQKEIERDHDLFKIGAPPPPPPPPRGYK